ncbi:MAG TPA: ATP-dependent DNA helicase, partial [Ktedonobacteraceae bacterium]|nr:ATP-dependent DNA helicase [Ktedonobacteraceae bacterium]
MTIAPDLRRTYLMNAEQEDIISHTRGPLLVIAGPGSGKTRSLLLLAMNLLLNKYAQPSELIICTYTEKAAREMQDRLLKFASDLAYHQDLASLHIGTIHGICKQLITENTHYTHIENDFTVLDQFTRQLLIFEEIDNICTPDTKRFLQWYWGSPWKVAGELGISFDHITEELLFDKLKETYGPTSPSSLTTDHDRLRYCLTGAYTKYQKILERRNFLDFAHLQKCVYNGLADPETFPHLTKGIRYVLVDEYQDTNYIQEQILIKLASATKDNNLFVVGDEDQALFRFRGATVRNILEFPQKFPGCKQIHLMTNYRSHQTIINTYNRWISSIDWSNPHGTHFRTEKHASSSSSQHKNYPAVCTMSQTDIYADAAQFAELVASLKEQGKINDYNQVALLLYSIKPRFSAPYIQALQKKDIPSFCPHTSPYFLHDEVCLMLGCLAWILTIEEDRNTNAEDNPFSDYLLTCQKQLQKAHLSYPQFHSTLQYMRKEIALRTQTPELEGKLLLDFFYRLITTSPFLPYIKGTRSHAAQPQNLEILSQMLQTFQRHYRASDTPSPDPHAGAHTFFHTFLRLLYNDEQNPYDASQQPLPLGHVPILTIHQAKGLEFPVVVVGRQDWLPSSSHSKRQKALQEFSHQPPFEPPTRIADFDLRRLYYVAFSRARSVLILSAVRKPGAPLASLWRPLPSWAQIDTKSLPDHDQLEEPFKPQPRYGFTSDIQLYTTCPRQFQFFRASAFAPSRKSSFFSGQLVHHTLEHIHRIARDGGLTTLDEPALAKIFESKYHALLQSYPLPIDSQQKTHAWQQILSYFQQNQKALQNIFAAELNVQFDRSTYVLTGKIDLLVKTADGIDLIDFKTHPRQDKNPALVEQYKQQLYFYAHALEQHPEHRPNRLFLYWTAEERKENALMEIPYQSEHRHALSNHLELVVSHIEEGNF